MAALTTDILSLPVAVSIDGTEYAPIVQGLGSTAVTRRVQTAKIAQVGQTSQLPGSIEFVIDGGGGLIAAKTWGYLQVPFNATLTSASLVSDIIGSIVVDVWMCTYAQFDAGVTHPVAADSITAGNPPTLTNATKSTNALTNWTTSLPVGNMLAFNVPSSSTNITRVTLSLNLNRVVS